MLLWSIMCTFIGDERCRYVVDPAGQVKAGRKQIKANLPIYLIRNCQKENFLAIANQVYRQLDMYISVPNIVTSTITS